ncbi:MAG: UDP-N-acetylglucosamine 2-epimerase [Nitrospirae bacterium GWD2_57_9]|nr:MAG: UDP-N-acetylglucosamine 2-epimerase [Nitrospirae bacterium GWD2_57_9]OGW50300.1 MAG: UDP-N-acetylglucosamine 2-epimerase [Nitrospirae bacterium GWC2_57_9]
MDNSQTITMMSIAGARPNFMKIASLAAAIDRRNREGRDFPIRHVLVHTGQHYDEAMSRRFFTELEIPEPDHNLGAGSGSHALQTAQIMTRFEPILLKEQPDVLLVVGDVNSTLACALVAVKAGYDGSRIRRPLIAHIEAGLRSRDRSMPEEINRIVTDALSDLLFVTEQEALQNLEHEGIPRRKIHFVGNVMIDTLINHREKARGLRTLEQLLESRCADGALRERFAAGGTGRPRYGLVTLHRPSNVDSREMLAPLMECMKKISRRLPLIFPLHPRTRKNLDLFGLVDARDPILYTGPLGYLEFLNLLLGADLVLTDSGGIQEETTFLRVPCITLRNNTERPVTVTTGTNYLAGTNPETILATALAVLEGRGKPGALPPLWDGDAAARVIAVAAHQCRKTGLRAVPVRLTA